MRKILLMIACVATAMCVNAQALKVSSAGNVGIDVISPTHKLQVNGDVFIGNINPQPNTVNMTPSGLTISQSMAFSNMQFIGYCDVYGYKNNQIRLGNTNNRLNTIWSYTINYQTLVQNSDMRLKENIQPCTSLLSKIKDIKSYNYNFKDEYFKDFTSEQKKKAQKVEYGFLAQELQKVFPELVHEDDSTNLLSINYIGMIPVLTSAINELQQEVETLRNALVACCSNKTQKSMQEFDLSSLEDAKTEELKAYQNAPNPFTETTIISCHILETIKKAELCIYDMSGSRLKCLTVTERGTTTIQIQAGQLAAGVYTYLLIGDGKSSEAKQMILTK